MEDCDPSKSEFTRLKSRSSKKDLRVENERLKAKLEMTKEMVEDLKTQKVYLEKELEAVRRSADNVREENGSLRRTRTDLQSKNDALKRELKFIRVAFRMGGLRYSCRAQDKQDTGTISVASFRSVVVKSNVNLSDEEMDLIVQRAMAHGDGQVIHYEAFFNALTDS